MIIIAAMGRNHVIGSGKGMPWEVPEEYQHFLETTRDQTIIIGRRSFEIFGPTLTCKQCIVVTRSDISLDNATVANSFEDARELAQSFKGKVFVAGGASIYKLAIERADQMLLSYIKGDFTGDTVFPAFNEKEWDLIEREDRGSYELVDYRRRN